MGSAGYVAGKGMALMRSLIPLFLCAVAVDRYITASAPTLGILCLRAPRFLSGLSHQILHLSIYFHLNSYPPKTQSTPASKVPRLGEARKLGTYILSDKKLRYV
jgi:hypothetical protein